MSAILQSSRLVSGEEKTFLGDDAVFTLISEQMPDALFLLDLDDTTVPGRIVYANESACLMHGYTREEITGRSIAELDDPETARQVKARLESLYAGETLHFEGVHRHKDGSCFPVEISARQVFWNGRRLALAVDRDIPDRHQTQKALQISENQYRALF
ncbi:MAG: PAS domain S-box protein [candidate division Zixibacteria bacterium]|nr:PAS domain S-box protein [candidate division Zixibacteria bacterium]